MKSQKALEERFESFLEREFKEVENLLIYQEGNDYVVFSKYVLRPNRHSVIVERYGNEIAKFSSNRTALSWCIADKYNQIRLADDILRLDQQKSMLVDDLYTRSSIGQKSKDPGLREIIRIKTETRNRKLASINYHLDKCVNLAKYWQIRGFNNETARTGRSSSNRTSR